MKDHVTTQQEMREKMNKIIQISVSSSIFGTSELYGIDNNGDLYQFDFDKKIWKTIKVNNFGQEGK